MIRFFRNLNLARAIILFSLAGAGYLAWTDWTGYQEIKFLRQVFPSQVGGLMRNIRREAALHSKLSEELHGDQFHGEKNMESYIRGIYDGLNLGALGSMKTREQRPRKGAVDRSTPIKPADSKKKFTHFQIANFLFELERQSRQIKVTALDMNVQGQRPKHGEIPTDDWTFSAEVTNRVKKDSAPPPNAVRP